MAQTTSPVRAIGCILASLILAILCPSKVSAQGHSAHGLQWYGHNGACWYGALGLTALPGPGLEAQVLSVNASLGGPGLLAGATVVDFSWDFDSGTSRVAILELNLMANVLDVMYGSALASAFDARFILNDMIRLRLSPLAWSFSPSAVRYEPWLRLGNDLGIQGWWLGGSLALSADWNLALRPDAEGAFRNWWTLTLSWRRGGLITFST